MTGQQTCGEFGWRWLRTTCWAIGIALLVIELSVGMNYLAAGLHEIDPGLFAWWPSFSMMAWELADRIAWHSSSLDSAARMMPLSTVPFALIATAIGIGRRIN